MINSLRRHPEGNILFAGCQNYLGVILWADDEFFLVTKIRNCVSNPITDICFSENTIYTVCDHNKGMALYFDDNLIRGRDERMRGPTTIIRKEFEKNMQAASSSVQLPQPRPRSQSKSPEINKESIEVSDSSLSRSNMTFSKVSQELPSKHRDLFAEFKIKQISIPNVDLKRV